MMEVTSLPVSCSRDAGSVKGAVRVDDELRGVEESVLSHDKVGTIMLRGGE